MRALPRLDRPVPSGLPGLGVSLFPLCRAPQPDHVAGRLVDPPRSNSPASAPPHPADHARLSRLCPLDLSRQNQGRWRLRGIGRRVERVIAPTRRRKAGKADGRQGADPASPYDRARPGRRGPRRRPGPPYQGGRRPCASCARASQRAATPDLRTALLGSAVLGGIALATVQTAARGDTPPPANAGIVTVPAEAGYADLAAAVMPAVVNVRVERTGTPEAGREQPPPDDPETRDFLERFFGQPLPPNAQPRPHRMMGEGSGFIVIRRRLHRHQQPRRRRGRQRSPSRPTTATRSRPRWSAPTRRPTSR